MKPERLTRHFDESKQESLELYDLRDIGLELRKNEKLSKLEDIEEELGIDLMTLFKALTDGFYFINTYGLIRYTRDYLKPVLDAYGKNIEIQEYVDNAGGSWYKMTDEYVKLSDYGKTWALTREELIK